MIALVTALMLGPPALGLHPSALVHRSLSCYELPANIRTTPDLRRAIGPLLARSPTLRAQCGKIAAASRTYVSLALSVGGFSNGTRARSIARRYPSGLLMIDVEIPPASPDFAELLAHEFEHVTEFIEGVDLRALAHSPSAGIAQCGIAGSFESVRAQRAGRTVAAEIDVADDTNAAPDRRTVRAPRSLPVTR